MSTEVIQANPIQEKKIRYDWLDAIKAFAMLMVIFVHLGLNGVKPIVMYTSFIKLPLFFAASGFVFKYKAEQSIWNFIKTRFSRIIVPYICLSVILSFLNYFETKLTTAEYIKQALDNIAVGKIMWFLPMLFIGNLVMFLIFKISKSNDGIILISAFASTVFGYFFISKEHIFMSANVVFVAYPMLVFGYYIKNFILNLSKNKLLIIALVSLAIYIIAPLLYKMHYGQLNYINMYGSLYCNYFYDLMIAYCGTLAFFIIFSFLKFPKPIVWFGKNTMFYYAFHIPMCHFVLYILRVFVSENFTHEYLKSSLKTSMIYFIITAFSLVLLVPICNLTNKYLPSIVGLKKNKTK